jgi:site-specific DNA-methyltransferase (adenine-specific)
LIDTIHIAVCMKPVEGSFAQNALEHGVAGLNIDDCRIGVTDDSYRKNCSGDRGHGDNRNRDMDFKMGCGQANEGGRWPANVILDGSEEVLEQFPETSTHAGEARANHKAGIFGIVSKKGKVLSEGDSGSASRFFKECPSDD